MAKLSEFRDLILEKCVAAGLTNEETEQVFELVAHELQRQLLQAKTAVGEV